jgi:hypothetical protein
LFQKVQAPNLAQVKSALQVSYDLGADNNQVIYDFIANSLAVEAASMADFAGDRQASRVDTAHAGAAPTNQIKGMDGAIFTGYKNFKQLSDSDKQAIFDKRTRLKIVPKKGGSRGGRSPVRSKPKISPGQS